MKERKTKSRLQTVFALLFLASCAGDSELDTDPPPVDDAGDAAFVHQAIVALLGRNPKGSAEVQALTELHRQRGGEDNQLQAREAVIDAIVEHNDEAFATYWGLVLVDGMWPDRMPANYQIGITEACLTDESLSFNDQKQLARDVVAESPTEDSRFPSPTMWDLAEGAVGEDDLRAFGLGWMAVLSAQQREDDPKVAPGQQADRLHNGVLNRNPECITCHRSTYSTTNASSGFDRFFPHRNYMAAIVSEDFANVNASTVILDVERPMFGDLPTNVTLATEKTVDLFTPVKPEDSMWGLEKTCGDGYASIVNNLKTGMSNDSNEDGVPDDILGYPFQTAGNLGFATPIQTGNENLAGQYYVKLDSGGCHNAFGDGPSHEIVVKEQDRSTLAANIERMIQTQALLEDEPYIGETGDGYSYTLTFADDDEWVVSNLESNLVCGDINGDGNIDVSDKLEFNSYLLPDADPPAHDDVRFWAADVNGDGTLDPSDQGQINSYILNPAEDALSCNRIFEAIISSNASFILKIL